MKDQEPNPYSTGNPVAANPSDAASPAWPISFENPDAGNFALPMFFGGVAIGFGLLMFLVHILLIDGGMLSLHMSSTAPVIGGVFLILHAIASRKAVRHVRLWPKGVEIVRAPSQDNPTQTIEWNEIYDVRIADSTSPGALNQKVVTLAGADNEPITTINGFQDCQAMVEQLKRFANLQTAHESSTSEKKQVSASGRKKGRRTALITGLGATLLLLAGIFLPIKAYQDQRAEQLLSESAIGSTGVVTERFVAPNGRTHRIRYEVTGTNGAVAEHNVEVNRLFYETVDVGSSIPVLTVPDEPDISRLEIGEVVTTDLLEKPVVTLILGIIGLVFSLFMIPMTVLQWKGYDVNFNNGKFSLVPMD